MARKSRKFQRGEYFHVLNRASLRARLFENTADYDAFVRVLSEAVDVFQLPLLAYCVMPTHWHLVVRPADQRHLSTTMQWLTTTHATRWCRVHRRDGPGPVYQGRFRSIAVEPNFHLARLCRYVERNASAAGLAARAEEWRWSSACQRVCGSEGPALVSLLFMQDEEWLGYLNEPHQDLAVRRAIRLNHPFGEDDWVKIQCEAAPRRPRGRPKKMGTDPI